MDKKQTLFKKIACWGIALTISFCCLQATQYIKIDNFLMDIEDAQKVSRFIQSLHISDKISDFEKKYVPALSTIKRLCILEDLHEILFESIGDNMSLGTIFCTHLDNCNLTQVHLYYKSITNKTKIPFFHEQDKYLSFGAKIFLKKFIDIYIDEQDDSIFIQTYPLSLLLQNGALKKIAKKA